MRGIMMRRLACNKFVRWGCFLLCCLMLAFLYIVTVWKEILLFILIGMAVFWGVKKKWPAMAFSICLLLLGWVCTSQWTRTRANLELLHFTLLKPYYQSKAEKVLEETAQAADTEVWGRIDGGSDPFLAKKINYSKAGGHEVVFFVIKYSDVSGYLYLPDEESISLIAEPSVYWSSVRQEQLFDVCMQELGDRWFFVRSY